MTVSANFNLLLDYLVWLGELSGQAIGTFPLVDPEKSVGLGAKYVQEYFDDLAEQQKSATAFIPFIRYPVPPSEEDWLTRQRHFYQQLYRDKLTEAEIEERTKKLFFAYWKTAKWQEEALNNAREEAERLGATGSNLDEDSYWFDHYQIGNVLGLDRETSALLWEIYVPIFTKRNDDFNNKIRPLLEDVNSLPAKAHPLILAHLRRINVLSSVQIYFVNQRETSIYLSGSTAAIGIDLENPDLEPLLPIVEEVFNYARDLQRKFMQAG